MNADEVEAQENGEKHEKEAEISEVAEVAEGKKKKDEQSSSPRGVLETHNLSVSSDFGSSSFGSLEETPPPAAAIADSPGGGLRGLNWKYWFDQIKKKKSKRKKVLGRIRSSEETIIDACHLPIPKPSWRNFTFQELAQATDNFSHGNIIVYLFCNYSILCIKRLKFS